VSLHPVTSRRGLRAFFAVGDAVHADDPRWVPPVRQQVRRWWRDGVRLYVLTDRSGRPVGRTTLHTDDRFDAKLGRRHQLFGLTEFTSVAAAEALFDAITAAGRQAGCQALFGPVALLPNQSGGVITSGYAERGFIDSAHNPDWYPAAYERAGFTRRFEADTWIAPVPTSDVWPERPLPAGVRIHRGDTGRLDQQLDLLRGMLNASFAQLGYYTEISAGQLRAQTDGLAHLLDESLLLYLTRDGRPVGFVLCLPDISEFVIRVRGDLSLRNQLRLLATRRRYRREAVLVVKGVVPGEQGRGYQRILSRELHQALRAGGYTTLRSTFVERNNPASTAQYRAMGGRPLHGYTFYEKPC
jgi:ribosomal protein S18 acetylase RimI-like enzyme